MRRFIGIAVLFLAFSGLVAVGSYMAAKRICAHEMARNADDLTWLGDEFHLSGADMARVRQLHEGYLPKCREICAKIADKKAELRLALDQGNGVTADVEQRLAELAALRTQCQTQMLMHFQEVSRAMPPGQGSRYLAEMQRLTLGFHEQMEQDMSHPTAHEPHH